MVITDFPFLPVLRIIATNSASVRLPAPNFLSFSRGLSSAGSSLTVKIFTSELIIQFKFIYQLKFAAYITDYIQVPVNSV